MVVVGRPGGRRLDRAAAGPGGRPGARCSSGRRTGATRSRRTPDAGRRAAAVPLGPAARGAPAPGPRRSGGRMFHYADDAPVQVSIRPSPGVDALYAPRRHVLDRILVDAAAEAGADVRPRRDGDRAAARPAGRVGGRAWHAAGAAGELTLARRCRRSAPTACAPSVARAAGAPVVAARRGLGRRPVRVLRRRCPPPATSGPTATAPPPA